MGYIWFFLIAGGCLLLVVQALSVIRRQHFYRLWDRKVTLKQERIVGIPLRCAALEQLIVRKLCPYKKYRRWLAAGDMRRIARSLKSLKMPIAAKFVEALGLPLPDPDEWLKIYQAEKYVPAALVAADLLIRNRRFEDAAEVLQRIEPLCKQDLLKAQHNLLMAQIYLYNADMLPASKAAIKAANLFGKKRALNDEAYAYLLAGIIYRAAAVEDVAHMMLEQAQKIFKSTKNASGEADALANLGMLWVQREKFEEAETCFAQSIELNQKIKRKTATALVWAQISLANILQKKFAAAQDMAQKALSLAQKSQDHDGQALAYQLLAYAGSEEHRWKDVRLWAEEAEKLYAQAGNMSAYLECLYLRAQACFEMAEHKASEQILRQLIETAQKQPSCFYIGNAYNLLGLIFLQQNELDRAKAVFLQSAAIEQKDERFSGAATDYNNIGIIEYKNGNKEQALKTFKTAWEYASAFGDNALAGMIKKRIDDLEAELK